jgi:hypothetical protein
VRVKTKSLEHADTVSNKVGQFKFFFECKLKN